MNFGDLKTHFQNLLNRSDLTTALSETFINQGIARIQRQLRVPMNEKVQNYTLSAQTSSLTLPTDFLEIISLYHSTNELERVSTRRFRELQGSVYTGTPKYFARQQEKVNIYPEPTSGTLVLYYYGEFDPMTADSDENILAQVAPDLIIYAALTYAADWFLDSRGELFEQKYNQFLTEIQEQANDQEMNGGVQRIEPAYRFDGE
jgi:hypothetical protein